MVGKEWVEGCGQRIRSVEGIGVSPMSFFSWCGAARLPRNRWFGHQPLCVGSKWSKDA